MALTIAGASYTYAGTSTPVLVDIDLVVPAGRVVGLVGPNDAGKSTLCLVAAGLAPTSIGGRLTGSVTLDGTETIDLKPYEAAQRCGILFQNPETQLSGTASTVFEEVAFGPRNVGLDLPAIIDRVDGSLALLGIEHLAPRDPDRLSGGQAQLVALASVLALQPGVLVLDEPTSQLDPAGTRLVGDALARLASESGTAILIVEHKADLLARLTHEVAVIAEGRLITQGPAGSVLGDLVAESVGVEPPAAVTIMRAATDAGVAERLAGIDLAALERSDRSAKARRPAGWCRMSAATAARRCAARASSSRTRAARARSTASTSRSLPASGSPSSGRTGRASRPSSVNSMASSSRTKVRSRSAASRRPDGMSPISPAMSGWPSRTPIARSSRDAWPRRSRSVPGTSDGPAATSTRPSRVRLPRSG